MPRVNAQMLSRVIRPRCAQTPTPIRWFSSSNLLREAEPFVVLKSVEEVRSWREERRRNGESVGFVPTMGALHDGHLSLARTSLRENDATIVSIFVNPAQFAPHEDLATYPRTVDADMKLLSTLSHPNPAPSSSPSSSSTVSAPKSKSSKGISALFLPPAQALYPSGITTEVSKQRGTFVEVKGLQEVMEGSSRPGFFRGVATVVLKLFNIVEPSRAYFGQKDIQQGLLLRRMLSDLHLSHPSPSDLVIQSTYRDPQSGLALSSRNAYLTAEERQWSTVVIDALRAAEDVWKGSRSIGDGSVDPREALEAARSSVRAVEGNAKEAGVKVEMKYFALNDPEELHDLEDRGERIPKGKGAVLSGAVMLGRTRLIDNMVFDFDLNPLRNGGN